MFFTEHSSLLTLHFTLITFYINLHQNLLSTALSLFRADPLPAQRLHGGTFSEVYEFTSRGESFILRLTPPNSGIDRDDMESVLHYMHYLSDGGLCVPSPLLSREGRLVEMIPDGDRTWLATVVQKARGVRAETIPFEGWTDRRIHLLGSLTGRMHRLSQGYQPPAEIKPRPGWDKVTNNYNPLDELPDAETDILERRQEVLARLEHLPRTPASFGLIHADLQFANFFIDPADDLLTLYDFDDCCQGWYMMDIALPLLDMLVLYPGHDREVFASRFLEHFITGYRTQCTPDPSLLAELHTFLKLLEIGLYLQVAAYAEEATPDSWVGKFMPGRKESILSCTPFVPVYL